MQKVVFTVCFWLIFSFHTWAAFTEFCCRSGGNNLNAGTRTGNSTEPGTSADFTYTGTFTTNTFTCSSGNPLSDGVAVGDFVHVSDDSSPGRLAKVTSRTSNTIVLDASVTLTFNAGTYTKARVGGAWVGPSGSNLFPFFASTPNWFSLTGAVNPCRINLKNDQTYSITTGLTVNGTGRNVYRGYTTSYGDSGRALIDGGTSTIVLLTQNTTESLVENFIFAHNGTTGSNAGVTLTSGILRGCVVHDVRGAGISQNGSAYALECEVYTCNTSNTANLGGFVSGGFVAPVWENCIAHDNSTGSNCHGFIINANTNCRNCIADTNAGKGFLCPSNTQGGMVLSNCDAYNNTSDGFDLSPSDPAGFVRNCNAVKNGGWGIKGPSGANAPGLFVMNCGFGSGTQANTSGTTTGAYLTVTGTVTYASNVTPWVDPANGDFTVTLATAKNAGLSIFTETASSYAGTVGHPDIGAAQSQASGGVGGVSMSRVTNHAN